MKQGYNVNDNVISPKRRNNVNDNVKGYTNTKTQQAQHVDNIADHLVSKFKAPDSRNFFCKCAWKLSEDDIWTAYEQATKPAIKAPLRYFITICSLKMSGQYKQHVYKRY